MTIDTRSVFFKRNLFILVLLGVSHPSMARPSWNCAITAKTQEFAITSQDLGQNVFPGGMPNSDEFYQKRFSLSQNQPPQGYPWPKTNVSHSFDLSLEFPRSKFVELGWTHQIDQSEFSLASYLAYKNQRLTWSTTQVMELYYGETLTPLDLDTPPNGAETHPGIAWLTAHGIKYRPGSVKFISELWAKENPEDQDYPGKPSVPGKLLSATIYFDASQTPTYGVFDFSLDRPGIRSVGCAFRQTALLQKLFSVRRLGR